MLNYRSKSEYILGIAASSRSVEAVLIHNAPSGPVVIRSFSRVRAGLESFGSAAAASQVPVALGSDVTFEMGSSSTSDMEALFLSSEFGPVESSKKEMAAPAEMPGSNLYANPCHLELLEIVAECVEAGYDHFNIVFALSTENLGTAVVKFAPNTPEKSDGKKRASKKTAKREDLLSLLKTTHPGKVTDHKTTFVPLAGGDSESRSFMAVFALANEPISLSLQNIRNRKMTFPNVILMDTEPTLMVGLVRAAILGRSTENKSDNLDREETTVLVRVGAEDTLVLFFSGDQLVHFEGLRSITAYDPAETICSRILLMHDEFGVGDADHMLLFSDVAENSMYQSLTQFFPQTSISLLRDVIPHFQEDRTTPIEKDGLLATAVALRLVRDELFETVFQEVDILDPKLKKRGFQMPFSWPIAAMILLLFGSTLLFVFRYFSQNHALEMTRYELKNFPEEMISEDADVLQMKTDSLRARSEGFVDALDLLDSLLIGSDKWSRALERTSVNTENITGLWVESWEATEAELLTMTGTATERSQIVAFATKSGANIESLSFSSIRNVPVFNFKMTMPLKNILPEAAVYLREHAADLPNAFEEAIGNIQSEVPNTTKL
ncbi:MAG: hypothetical protein O3B41_00575 [Bacteroidetes bacterium]|nr:hypothetical protein [Bacteroidota bacterium]